MAEEAPPSPIIWPNKVCHCILFLMLFSRCYRFIMFPCLATTTLKHNWYLLQQAFHYSPDSKWLLISFILFWAFGLWASFLSPLGKKIPSEQVRPFLIAHTKKPRTKVFLYKIGKLRSREITLLGNYNFSHLLSTLQMCQTLLLSISHTCTHFILPTNPSGRLPSHRPFADRFCNEPKFTQLGRGHFKVGILVAWLQSPCSSLHYRWNGDVTFENANQAA